MTRSPDAELVPFRAPSNDYVNELRLTLEENGVLTKFVNDRGIFDLLVFVLVLDSHRVW